MKQGIDVSKHNGNIDWTKVKAAGKEFAFIRLGWCGYEGDIKAAGGLDPKFEENIKQAQAAGIEVGVYVYSYAKTPEAARRAGVETAHLLQGYQLAYPVVFDIEDEINLKLDKAANTAICKAFLDAVQQAGYYAMLYTFKSFAEYNLNMADMAAYDVWIAQWAQSCSYTGNYGIWQYSATGTVPGISGDVDLNIAYKDYPGIIRAAGLNGFTETGAGLPSQQTVCPRCRELEDVLAQIKQLAEVVEH